MDIRSIGAASVEGAVESLVSAFASDPLMAHLFGTAKRREAHVAEFFRILLEVRVRLGMPAFLAQEGETVLGAVMGYDLSRPNWPQEFTERLSALMRRAEALESRLGGYERAAEKFEPHPPHYYLGVIGVREGHKGAGVGTALLREFCAASDRDSASCGVYLETASESSLLFYQKHGFVLQGEADLDEHTHLWCVFRRADAGAAP